MLIPRYHRSDEQIIKPAMLDSFGPELTEKVVMTKTVIGTISPGKQLPRLRNSQWVTNAYGDLSHWIWLIKLLNPPGSKFFLRVPLSQLPMGVAAPWENLPSSRDC
jgi:hypothetical protein